MKILITGSSSGIGHGLAEEFLRRGEMVWGISRRDAPFEKEFENYHHLNLDLTDYERTKKEIPLFLKDIPQFDLVILNAGILGEIKWMSEVGIAEMKRVVEINVWANKNLLDILFGMKINIDRVVGISSKAALRSTPGWGPYSMSKAGLNMLMNIYAKEVPGTHFSAFAPGLVDSEIQEEIYQVKEKDKYPTVERLQNARYTDEMPDARSAAPKLIDGMKKALEYESGSFVDVREM